MGWNETEEDRRNLADAVRAILKEYHLQPITHACPGTRHRSVSYPQISREFQIPSTKKLRDATYSVLKLITNEAVGPPLTVQLGFASRPLNYDEIEPALQQYLEDRRRKPPPPLPCIFFNERRKPNRSKDWLHDVYKPSSHRDREGRAGV